jgi:hypothetical protein
MPMLLVWARVIRAKGQRPRISNKVNDNIERVKQLNRGISVAFTKTENRKSSGVNKAQLALLWAYSIKLMHNPSLDVIEMFKFMNNYYLNMTSNIS